MKKQTKIILYSVVAILFISGISLFAYSKLSKNTDSEALAESLCVQRLSERTKPATFEEYPIEEMYAGESAELDMNSSFIARRFRTYFKDALAQGANFAGHYAIAEWGFTGLGREMGVVDVQTGKAYVFPYVAETNFSYEKDSNLLIVDPIESICAYEMGAGVRQMMGSGKDPREASPHYFLWENNSFTLLNPQDGEPSIDTVGHLSE
jgi:hypothetical protein